MPDNYLDSSLQTGFDDSTKLALKLDTEDRINKVLAPSNVPDDGMAAYRQNFAPQPDSSIDDVLSGKVGGMNIIDAALSPDTKISNTANQLLEQKVYKDPFSRGEGAIKFAKYDQTADKFIDKQFGYRPDRDNEDFYHENEYMQDGFAVRSLKNIGKFVPKVLGLATLKLGEGLATVGSFAVGGIQKLMGGDNDLWADIADNSMSKYLENGEQSLKNSNFFASYRAADYDKKGIFSKARTSCSIP